MRIYLAARYGRRDEMKEHAEQLRAIGHDIHVRWLSGAHDAAPDHDGTIPEGDRADEAANFALDDYEDLQRSEVVLAFTENAATGGRARGGRHVEYGLALGWRKTIVVVGPIENVFHALPWVYRVDTWPEAMALLTPSLAPSPWAQAQP